MKDLLDMTTSSFDHSDGNNIATNHAIIVYQDMIFDLLHEKILKRCRQTLDWCCRHPGFRRLIVDMIYVRW